MYFLRQLARSSIAATQLLALSLRPLTVLGVLRITLIGLASKCCFDKCPSYAVDVLMFATASVAICV